MDDPIHNRAGYPFCPSCSAYFPSGTACPECGQPRLLLDTPAAPNTPVWRAEVPGSVAVQLAIARCDGKPVLAAAWGHTPRRTDLRPADGGVTLLNLADGSTIWQESVGMPVEGGAAIADTEGARIVVGTAARWIGAGEGAVVALDLQTGKVEWRTPLGGAVRGSPAVDGVRVYAAAGDGLLYCLDARNGHIVQRLQVCGHPTPVPASPIFVTERGVVQSIIVATYGRTHDRTDGQVVAFDSDSSCKSWEFGVAGNVRGTPVQADGKLYVTAFHDYPSTGLLYALDARTRRAIWREPFTVLGQPGDRGSFGFPASAGVDGGLLYVGCLNHRLYAIRAATGEPAWNQEVGAGIATTPVVVRGLVVFGANDGKVYALDATTGSLFWKCELGAPLLTSPIAYDDTIFIGSDAGAIVALPWHLGHYAESALREEQRGSRPVAAGLWALAGEIESADYARKRKYIERARALFTSAGHPDLAARLLRAQLWAKPAEVGREFQSAAQLVVGRDRALAVELLYEAAECFDEAELFGEVQECERQASLLDPAPRLTLRCLTAERQFEPDQQAPIAFEIKNRGKSEAEVFIRLGGVLAQPIWTTEPLRIGAHGSSEFILEMVPTGAGNLMVELTYRDDRGRDHHEQKAFPLNVRAAPDIVTEDDAGAVIVRTGAGAPAPRIRVKGMVGLLRVEIIGSRTQAADS